MAIKKINDSTILATEIEDIALICEALSNSTRLRIIESIRKGIHDLESLSLELNLSKGNLSTQIRKLENVGIVSSRYIPGDKGVRKLLKLEIKEIRIVFK